jgi:signal transduction histidine kinase
MLRAFLTENREELIERCRSKVGLRRAPRAPPPQTLHGVPLFLSQLVATFPDGVDSAPETELCAAQAASKHGQELLQQGFTIEQVVHDYGDLCQSITELAAERVARIPPDDFGILNIRLDEAIASAVAAYSQQQAIAVAAQTKLAADERIGALASEMRNLVNTSMLAISAMKRGSVGFGGATAAALDRSIARMRGLIDRTLADIHPDSRGSPHAEIIEIGPFIAAVQLAAAVEAARRGCDLTVVVEPDIYVEADRHILGSAVSNLLNGVLRSMQRDGHLFLSAYARMGRVIIDVEDSGASLEIGALRDILEGFADRASATTALGSALLCCAQGIEASGGSLTARAAGGGGCLYTIDLCSSAHRPETLPMTK